MCASFIRLLTLLTHNHLRYSQKFTIVSFRENESFIRNEHREKNNSSHENMLGGSTPRQMFNNEITIV